MYKRQVHGLKETIEPSVPKFESQEEFLAWAFKNTSEAIKNVTERCQKLEEAVQKIPPPGADMIKYKIPGDEGYSNLKELFDNLFDRLDHLEDRLETAQSLNDRLNTLEDSILPDGGLYSRDGS